MRRLYHLTGLLSQYYGQPGVAAGVSRPLQADPLWAGAPGWLTGQTLVPGGTALCAALSAYGLVTRVRGRRKRPEQGAAG